MRSFSHGEHEIVVAGLAVRLPAEADAFLYGPLASRALGGGWTLPDDDESESGQPVPAEPIDVGSQQ